MQHKDEMSKIALTGPGGRKGLKDYIKSLEDTIKTLQDRVEELENAPTPEPEIKIIEILSESEDYEPEDEALARITLNGEATTKQQLIGLSSDMPNVFIKAGLSIMPVIHCTETDSSFSVYGGYYCPTADSEDMCRVEIDGSLSRVQHFQI